MHLPVVELEGLDKIHKNWSVTKKEKSFIINLIFPEPFIK